MRSEQRRTRGERRRAQDERGRAVRLTYACLLSPEKRQKKQKRRNNEKLKTEKS